MLAYLFRRCLSLPSFNFNPSQQTEDPLCGGVGGRQWARKRGTIQGCEGYTTPFSLVGQSVVYRLIESGGGDEEKVLCLGIV